VVACRLHLFRLLIHYFRNSKYVFTIKSYYIQKKKNKWRMDTLELNVPRETLSPKRNEISDQLAREYYYRLRPGDFEEIAASGLRFYAA